MWSFSKICLKVPNVGQIWAKITTTLCEDLHVLRYTSEEKLASDIYIYIYKGKVPRYRPGRGPEGG